MGNIYSLYENSAEFLEKLLAKIGINVPLIHYAKKSKVFFKFGAVGAVGTLVDFFFYKLFINSFGLPPATAKGFSTEFGIINNFLLNNYWTFKERKTKNNIWQRFGIFNIVSFGGLAISVLVIKFLHGYFGDGFIQLAGVNLAYNNFYFFATIPPVMAWNFTINHLVTWRHAKD